MARLTKIHHKIFGMFATFSSQMGKFGSLHEGVQVAILEENENWARIAVTGWIYKPSLSAYPTQNTEGKMRALHILTKTESQAKEALKKIESGIDFSTVAKQYSILPNANKGGDLGYFAKGDFDPQIETAIIALKVNQISSIIKSSFGYNIFKRLK